MKIIFSPFFDGEKYINYSQTPIIDRTYLGQLGLLNELELRSGLTCMQIPEIERQAVYLLALKNYLKNNPDSMFAESFQVDDFGVATELLRWRDELVKAGWCPHTTGTSEKIDTLALIEKEFACIGDVDRWVRVVERTMTDKILPDDWEIEAHIKQDLLQPVFSVIFHNLEEQGVKISYIETPVSGTPDTNLHSIQKGLLNPHAEIGIDPSDKSSLRIIKFKRLCDAYEWAAQQEYDTNHSVIVNEARKAFNNVLFSYDKARSTSVIKNSNPQVVQLFKLGLSLFIKPLNVYNLLSYLQVQVNPIPSDLRFKLMDIIIGTGGIGQEWEDAIDSYEFKDVDGNIDTAKKKRMLVFISMVSGNGDGSINASELKKYVAAMNAWATGRLNMGMLTDTGIREQLSNITIFYETLQILLNDTKQDAIPYNQLKSWIQSIYRPANYTHEDAQETSVTVVESPMLIADKPKQIVWLDCYGRTSMNYPFDFLNKKEIEDLRRDGVQIWDKELSNKAAMWAIKNAILKVSVCLDMVVPEEDQGKKLPAHPIIIELQERLKDKFDHLIVDESGLVLKTEQKEIYPLPQSQVEYKFANLYTVRRETESYSSLEKLIEYPFDYTLEYFAQLRDKGVRQLQDLERTKGNVAHRIIETLVTDAKGSLRRFIELSRDELDTRFQTAVQEVGMILMLEENRIEQEKFKIKIRNSLGTVFPTIIEANCNTIVGCEIEEVAEFDGMPAIATRMDMLLTNRAGEYIIIDLKWSESNYYKRKIQGNKAMQLEIYRAVMERKYPDRKVAAAGYFLLAKGILVTADLFPPRYLHIEMITKENDTDVFTQVHNSYRYRYEQFAAGIVEEGETINLDDIQYYNDTATHNLYPLDIEYGTDNEKAVNKYSPYTTLKGHLK